MIIRLLFALLLLAPVARAQEDTNAPPNDHYLVKFFGENTNTYPVFWPAAVTSCDSNTVAVEPWHLFTQEQFDELRLTNSAEFKLAQDAKHAALQASINAKIAALVAAYSNLQWCADNWASVTNLATLRIAVKAEGDLLLKLGPVLREIYKPENDTTP